MSYYFMKGIETHAKRDTKRHFGIFWWLIYTCDRNRFIKKQNGFFMKIFEEQKSRKSGDKRKWN